jgi:hypothetical protein
MLTTHKTSSDDRSDPDAYTMKGTHENTLQSWEMNLLKTLFFCILEPMLEVVHERRFALWPKLCRCALGPWEYSTSLRELYLTEQA